MARQARGVAHALCVVVVVLLVHGVARGARAASYNVGNSAGWDVSADLQSWADGKKFDVGDVLVFQYSKYHKLDEVDEAGFRNCSAANALLSKTDGNTTVPLTARGDRYFICGNQMHCLGGMKLHVLVGPPTRAAPAGAPLPSPGPGPGAGADDDAGIPRLVIGGSHVLRLGTTGPILVTWLCVYAAAALFVL